MINWNAFDWPSFATLTTGLAAVFGATVVGLKQAGIAKRQADITERQAGITERQNIILDRQTKLEELQLKSDLYERRLAIFEVTESYIIGVMNAATRPPDTLVMEFQRAIDRSHFLFRPEVAKELGYIRKLGFSLTHHRSNFEHMVSTDKPKDYRLVDKIEEESDRMASYMLNLVPLFGHELRLGLAEDRVS